MTCCCCVLSNQVLIHMNAEYERPLCGYVFHVSCLFSILCLECEFTDTAVLSTSKHNINKDLINLGGGNHLVQRDRCNS